MVIFHSYVNVYQRVHVFGSFFCMLYLPMRRQARLRQYGPSKCGGGPASDHLRAKYIPSVDKVIIGGWTNGYTTAM